MCNAFKKVKFLEGICVNFIKWSSFVDLFMQLAKLAHNFSGFKSANWG